MYYPFHKTVCGLGMYKDSAFYWILCAYGREIQHKFGILTEELETLCNLMEPENVAECAMESTSIYRIPIWRVFVCNTNTSIYHNLVKHHQCVQRCNIRISNYISAIDSKVMF